MDEVLDKLWVSLRAVQLPCPAGIAEAAHTSSYESTQSSGTAPGTATDSSPSTYARPRARAHAHPRHLPVSPP
jgi:hypothetical protein